MKDWAILFFGATTFLVLSDTQRLKKIIHHPIFKWTLLFSFFVMVWGWFGVAIKGTYGEVAIDQFNTYFLAILFLFTFLGLLIRESAFVLARKVMVVILIGSVLINIYDFISFNPSQFSRIYGRAAGLYKDPNNSSIVLAFGLIATYGIIRPKFRFAYAIWIFLGVLLTQSRGGILTYTGILALLFYKKTFSKKSLAYVFALLLVVGAFTSLLLLDQFKSKLSNIQNQRGMFERFEQLLGKNTHHVKEDVRLSLLAYNLDLWLQQPVTGNGLGASSYLKRYSPDGTESHNQLLLFLVDFGIGGLIIWGSFLLTIITANHRIQRSFEAMLFLLPFALFSMVSHNLFDYASLIFFYTFYARLLQYQADNQTCLVSDESAPLQLSNSSIAL